ncbi:carboxypeptidase-like regulatory domain-containing protein [Solirubrobacter soli]|uniref:carboxypeptidase-like regulatory domain-containing protein n=1 Tax=Solirubrobacter soli TaxID=363832 RepID=UPI000419CEAB|nr:carboxypeptidase-like regulatory domain-containing protein [Solirubrobacter soli]
MSTGTHSLTGVLTDVAGNSTVVGPFELAVRTPVASISPITTVDPPVVVPLPPVAGSIRIDGGRTLHSRYSKPPLVKGTVKATDGSPLANVVVTTSDGTTAKTDGKGRFSVKLAKGSNREVRISYGDSVQTVKVIVAAPIRLKTDKTSTRNGRSITFTGSVPGAEEARTLVELQALAHGKWMAFKTAQLRNGKFKAGYRFTRTFFTQRYSFRAVVREDDGFPYAAGKSAVVRVVVRA